MTARPVLELRDLRTHFVSPGGVTTKAVDGVNLQLMEGETLGLVGESGSGKSITALSILRLLPPGARVVGGEILLNGESLLHKTEAEMAQIRGRELSMILQDPLTALNPVLSIRDQMTEALRHEDGVGAKSAVAIASKLLRDFRIADPETKLSGYPHHMSGGMRQRVLGAIAVSRNPTVLIADEPTTSLDATLQLEYLRLLKAIQAETGVSIIFVTHDFGVVERMCDRVAVMYAGKIVETARVDDLFSAPAHPYTEGLLSTVLDPYSRPDILPTIEGEPPNLSDLGPGCSFAPRCPYAFDRCLVEYPPEFQVGAGHAARCWLLEPETHD